jgi:hypothetical protein
MSLKRVVNAIGYFIPAMEGNLDFGNGNHRRLIAVV